MMYFKFILASQILNLATLLTVGQTRSCTFEPHPKSVSNGVSDSHDKVVSHRIDDTAHYQVDATYSQSDISRINSLLREASQLKEKPKSWMLWFGKKFIGVPYVGGTLDRAEEEKLVINTSELDCTTFVEIVTALTRCMSGNGKRDFSDFCRQLQHVRYINGEIAYEKRQHYFTVWISDNAEEGIVTDIQNNPPFTKVQHVSVNWMTTHQQSYKMLKNNAKRLQGIKALEEQISGKSYRYIPKEQIVDSRLFRNTIHNGDILVMITNKN